MLAALAFVLAGSKPIIEVPDRTADRVTIQAVFKLPKTEALSRAAADVLSRVITDDNDTYSKPQMQALCAPGGEPRCYVLPDSISISLSVLPSDTGLGMRMLAGMVATPRFSLDVMNGYLSTEPLRHKPVWSLALDNSVRAWDRLRVEDITNLYKTVFRPDNLDIAVGGAIKPGVAATEWAAASSSWRRQPAKPLRTSEPFKDFPQIYDSHVLELRGPEWNPTEAAPAARLLAVVALGGGKGSSLFRVVREGLGLSYRQEALLWPTLDGFVPRILVQTSPKAGEEEQKELQLIRSALLEDVDKWTEQDLARAKGYTWTMLDQGVPYGVLYFRPSGPLGSSIEHRTFLAAYMSSKMGRPWDAGAMAKQIGDVDLETLKSTSADLLKTSIPLLHPSQRED